MTTSILAHTKTQAHTYSIPGISWHHLQESITRSVRKIVLIANSILSNLKCILYYTYAFHTQISACDSCTNTLYCTRLIVHPLKEVLEPYLWVVQQMIDSVHRFIKLLNAIWIWKICFTINVAFHTWWMREPAYSAIMIMKLSYPTPFKI